MDNPSSEALVGLAWYSMDGSCRELRQIAHVSVQMDHDHTATAFHCFGKRGGGQRRRSGRGGTSRERKRAGFRFRARRVDDARGAARKSPNAGRAHLLHLEPLLLRDFRHDRVRTRLPGTRRDTHCARKGRDLETRLDPRRRVREPKRVFRRSFKVFHLSGGGLRVAPVCDDERD